MANFSKFFKKIKAGDYSKSSAPKDTQLRHKGKTLYEQRKARKAYLEKQKQKKG